MNFSGNQSKTLLKKIVYKYLMHVHLFPPVKKQFKNKVQENPTCIHNALRHA